MRSPIVFIRFSGGYTLLMSSAFGPGTAVREFGENAG